MNAKKMTLIAILLSIAIVLSILDSLIPSFVPGMKLGLANVVILIVLYTLGVKEAIFVNLSRVYLAALLRGTIFNMGFLMSLSGAVFSLLVMMLLKVLFKKLSIVGVSVVGAVFHSLGQILVAVLYLGTTSMFYYLPILCITSVITGIIMGLIAKKIIDSKVIQKQRDKYGF